MKEEYTNKMYLEETRFASRGTMIMFHFQK